MSKDDKKVAVDNVADEKQVKKADWKDRDRRRKELEDVAFILSSPQGRRFYWRYLDECGIYKTSVVPGYPDSYTFLLEGQRNIGIKLMTDLQEADPDAYILMLKENQPDGET